MRGAILASGSGDGYAMPIGRRGFLLGTLSGIAGAAAFARPRLAFATALEAHTLSFYHVHTGETLKITYREHGEVVPGAHATINNNLRDLRNGEKQPIDVALLDQVCKLYCEFDCRGHFEVISAYRSPKTNEALRHVSTGVAKNSLHLEGRAIDVRLTSAPLGRLRDAAIDMRSGGVGYYPDSNFVHVDTGAFRTW
jgi:uncharacterized protein YcbK (DUF882 family)